MANAPQMKIPIGADTSDFEKGAQKVKQEMKDLNKVSSDAFSAIGNALGVNVGKLQQFSNALGGFGTKLQKTGEEGKKAFGEILTAIAPVGGAIAGLGIVAATTAFKALKEEAQAFKDTVEGANIEMATAAYISTYKQVLHDLNKEMGESAADAESKWSKFWGTMWANAKQFFRSGAFAESLMIAEGGTVTGEGSQNYRNAIAQATSAAKSAEQLTNEIYNLERKRKEQAIEIAKINSQIADRLSVARDTEASIADRQQAISDIEDLIAAKKKLTVTLEEKLADLYEQRSALASDSIEDADAVLAQRQRAYDTERNITEQSNSLLKLKNQIAKAAKASAEYAKAEYEIRAHWDEAHANAPGLVSSGPVLNNAVQVPVEVITKKGNIDWFKEHLIADLGDIKIALEIDPKSVEKIYDITNEINAMVEKMSTTVGEALGELAGNLINGEDPWGQFANAALSAMGDMAVTVGKMAISTGVATLGIKAALESLNGYVAIAAGVALVALGTAVKTGLSNVASGNYSSGMGTVSNTTSSIGNAYAQREVYVNVTGTLRADGNQLVAVLNNTNKRNNVTT